MSFFIQIYTHVACTHETANCQLFILIIGGRFGGKHILEKDKSITNAEYIAAKEQNIPIFAFVKQDVLNDHNLWQRNKDKKFAKEITHPSIEKQEHAADIFGFIDQVRHSAYNNSFFGFRLTKEILGFLRKQWAGMMFEYLQTRSLNKQIATTNQALASLTAASEKIEDIVKNIYININAPDANATLDTIDLEGEAREFLESIASKINDRHFIAPSSIPDIIEHPPENWDDFLVAAGFFEKEKQEANNGSTYTGLIYFDTTAYKLDGNLAKPQQAELSLLQHQYNAFKQLNHSSRSKLLKNFIFTPESL